MRNWCAQGSSRTSDSLPPRAPFRTALSMRRDTWRTTVRIIDGTRASNASGAPGSIPCSSSQSSKPEPGTKNTARCASTRVSTAKAAWSCTTAGANSSRARATTLARSHNGRSWSLASYTPGSMPRSFLMRCRSRSRRFGVRQRSAPTRLRGAAACLRRSGRAGRETARHHDRHSRSKDRRPRGATSLNPDLVTALHDTRLTANWSMHDGVSFSADEVADLSELVREVVEILYVQPAARSALAVARAARRGGESA